MTHHIIYSYNNRSVAIWLPKCRLPVTLKACRDAAMVCSSSGVIIMWPCFHLTAVRWFHLIIVNTKTADLCAIMHQHVSYQMMVFDFYQVNSTYFCLRLFGGRGGSLAGFSKMSRNIGSNFLNVTIDTAKFRSSRSILSRNSCGKLAMSAHFFIFLKNSMRLKHHKNATTFSNTTMFVITTPK